MDWRGLQGRATGSGQIKRGTEEALGGADVPRVVRAKLVLCRPRLSILIKKPIKEPSTGPGRQLRQHGVCRSSTRA